MRRACLALLLIVTVPRAFAQPSVGSCTGPQMWQSNTFKGCGDLLDWSTAFVLTPGGGRMAMGMTRTSQVDIIAATCQGTTAFANWDLSGTEPARAACKTGSNIPVKGVMLFEDGTTTTAESVLTTMVLPSDWIEGTGVTVLLKWLAVSTSGSVEWCMQKSCVAAGATDDPTWDTAVCLSDPAQGTTLQTNDAALTFAAGTFGACAANSLFHFKLYRDADDGTNDTMSGDAQLEAVRLIFNRAG